jgi:3-hydroxyacyl-[acyl-carrier-protein] dehydratase
MHRACRVPAGRYTEHLLCRYPFLLVDRVVEWELEKYAVGYKNVTINDNFFNGHFPGRPIMPGTAV